MDSLYVCHFSNGHIKVGRSNDPEGRIRQHTKRVECLGISLFQSFDVECAGSALSAEISLIGRCAKEATQRHHHEWFTGLNYADVCGWATKFAESAPPPHEDTYIDTDRPDWRNVLRVLKLAGYTQLQLAGICGCSQASISELSCGITRDPSYSIGATLIELTQTAQSSVGDLLPLVSDSLNSHGLKHVPASPATPHNVHAES